MLIYSPDANNLNNFIAKLRAFTEGGRRKSRANVSGVCSTFGVQNLNPQQEKAVAEFLTESDIFVNLPTGYGKPLMYHMAPLVSGDWTFKAAQPFSKRKHSRMQNLAEKKSESLQQFSRKKNIILLSICTASTLYTLALNTPSNSLMKTFVGFFNGYSHAWMIPRASKSAHEQTNYSEILQVFSWGYGLNIYLNL